jgi:WD40 repeat protein
MFKAIGWSGEDKAPMPLEMIELDHIFGYQGSDRKCNDRILRTGEVIYTAGCIAIVSNNSTRKQRHFMKHPSAIVSFTVHPDNSTICSLSNGEQPSILIWDSITMEVSHNLGHLFTTGFTTVSFGGPRGENLLVIGDDDLHTMTALEWNTEMELISKYTQVSPLDLLFPFASVASANKEIPHF